MSVHLENIPRTIRFVKSDDHPILIILDQTKLPYEEEYLHVTDWREVIDCIKTLKVRGAPAIGIAGAASVALCAFENANEESKQFVEAIVSAAEDIKHARPTAVNLAWAVDACMNIVNEEAQTGSSSLAVEQRLYEFVNELIVEDENANREIGRLGAELLPHDCTVLTHCNAGSLATAFYGTALGIIYAAAEQGKIKRVYSDETRPVGQGARLTVWELAQAGVPVTLICDDMAADIMSRGKVDAVIVGADRVAANGDVANKIGTLGVAALAYHFNIPFYVACPSSTVDPNTPTGSDICIEQRDPVEVLPTPIEGVDVYNPAFDVTPAALVTKIITERGVFDPKDVAASVK